MKKAIITLAALVTLSMVGGSLFNTLANLNREDNQVNVFASVNPFPYEMPNVMINPVSGSFLL